MALGRVGSPPEARRTESGFVERGPLGIPGSRRPVLFYQEHTVLPKAARGEGIYIWDTDGKRYLDGCSGAIVANLGHGNKRIRDAALAQLDRIAFTYRQQFRNDPADDLAELLVQLSPPGLDRVFFVNSGSEAVESAVKLARQYWWATGREGKGMVVSRSPSFHGATLGALALTSYAPLKVPFQPLLKHLPKVPAPFCYHCPLGRTYPECGVACAWELDKTIDLIGAENIAAFITEPIGGSSTGAAVPPDEYLPIVEKICHDNEILLIIDDVMTGCGRTGTFYGYEHWPIAPDMVATSKGLSAGYTPIGAVIASGDVVETVMEHGGFPHGHTYAGNPLSAAITLEAVRTIIDEKLVENARVMGTYLHERLHELKERFPIIGDVRGRGLLSAVEFVRDRAEREPFPAHWLVAQELTTIARQEGLLVYPRRSILGVKGDHVMVAPPLIIDRAGIDELIDLLARSIERLSTLLEKHVEHVPPTEEAPTEKRYDQAKELPAYALGDLSEVSPVEDANLTGGMSTGLESWTVDPDDDGNGDAPEGKRGPSGKGEEAGETR